MIQVFKIPRLTILDSHVTNKGFATVGQIAAWMPDYNFIINGDGWYNNKSASIWYSEGVGKNQTQKDWRPWINFDKNNNYKFGWVWGTHWLNFNCISGTRFIVENGLLNKKWQTWSPELNARTGVGIDTAGDLVVAVVDGHDLPFEKGVSLEELALLFLESNCVTAMDLDGGGSTTLYVNGGLANEPNDDGVAVERAVVNHLCLRLHEIPGIPEPPEPPEPPPAEFQPYDELIGKFNAGGEYSYTLKGKVE